MIFAVRESRIEIHGRQTDYIRFGRGPKPLIMIQGLNTRGLRGAGLGLAYMYRCFAREYTVYLFDRRAEVREGLSVRELAADVAEAMDALGIGRADVFGVSQGGMIAQYLAIDRPDLVSKLVLALTLSRNNDTVVSVVGRWIALAEQGAMRALVTDMTEKMYSEAYARRYRALMPLLTALQKPRDVRRFTVLAKACLSCRAYEELDRIQCPAFVIGAGQDRVVGAEAAEELAQKLGCRIFMYEGLGHAAYQQAKDFNRKVLDFLRE